MAVTNKSFILLKGEYKTYTDSWKTVSATLPSLEIFKSEGMDDLSVLDRKETKLTIPMDNNTLQGEVLGGGRVFKETVDLNKFIDLVSIKASGK